MSIGKEIESIYVHTTQVHNRRTAEIVLPILLSHVTPVSLLDVGCGLGSWLDVARHLGVKEYLGIDGEHVDFSKLFIPRERLLTHDLTKPLNLGRKFDLVICLEVAEHLPETASDVLINTLTDHSETILFSAAMPGQGGQNHLNEKRLSYWSMKFMKHGYALYDFIRPQIWNNPAVELWYKQNIVLFCKQGHYLENILRPLSSPYVDIIHPELFEFYSSQAARVVLYEEGKLGIKSSLAAFIKSVANKFK